jgi:hypothetical protein
LRCSRRGMAGYSMVLSGKTMFVQRIERDLSTEGFWR